LKLKPEGDSSRKELFNVRKTAAGGFSFLPGIKKEMNWINRKLRFEQRLQETLLSQQLEGDACSQNLYQMFYLL
jgi:hypothetical protein